jgi:hypothetical protein
MAQPAQVVFNTPSNDMCVIDNSAAQTTTTLAGPNNSSPIGFDTVNPPTFPTGAQAQGLNSFGDTGTVLLDSVNDQIRVAPHDSTFPGNPVSFTNPTYKTLTTVLNDNRQGLRILFKNPS